MSTKSKVTQAPGAEVPETTVEQIVQWSKKDLAVAISFLNALYSDPDLLMHCATFMKGRMDNAKHKEAIKDVNQQELFHVEPNGRK